MQTTQTQTKTYCDCCNKEMPSRLFYRNDGSYQADFIVYKGLHICHICGARLFCEYADKLDLNPEELKDKYLDLNERFRKNTQLNMEKIKNIFKFGDVIENK